MSMTDLSSWCLPPFSLHLYCCHVITLKRNTPNWLLLTRSLATWRPHLCQDFDDVEGRLIWLNGSFSLNSFCVTHTKADTQSFPDE